MGINDLLSIARDALAAQSFGVDVTGQNVSNVNTPGYVRRSALLEARSIAGASEGGVNVAGVARAYDRFLDARNVVASGLASSAESHDGALGSLQAIFNDTGGTGLNDQLSQLFGSFTALAANPADPTTRATVLARADDFARTLRDSSSQIASQRQDMLTQAQGMTGEANGIATRIAKLNGQIAQAQALGQDAADLQDQRSKLVGDLAQTVDVHAFVDGQGRFVVRTAGATLVEGDTAGALSVSLDKTGALQLLAQRGGSPPVDVTSQLSGGKLMGIKQARDVDATALQGRLDQLAFDVATAIDKQHAAGFGLDGVSGRSLFQVAAPPGSAATIQLDPQMVGHPERVAASDTALNVPGGSANAVALSGLASANITGSGTRTATEGYSDLVGDLGARKQASASDVALREAQAAQTKAMRDSTSGVSLDEEMVSLTKYQRGYEAASKLVKTADDLLAQLMQTI